MKKIYMTMVAMLCGAAAMAQTCTISAADFDIAAGDTPGYLEILINQDGTSVNGCGTVIELPEGLSVRKYWDDDDEAWKDDFESPAAKSAFTVMLVASDENPNKMTLAVASVSATFKTSTNVLARIGLLADKNVAKNGANEIKIGPTSFNIGTTSVYPQETFTVIANVTGAVGINGINAADSKAPVYNLAGQRVSKTQKGVFIQNGKKVAVK
jgi:hypothetical protein